ncbi:MAG: MFS transporter [Pelolinea sp.]|nr:MFS transporter [Pelolinea sp.]
MTCNMAIETQEKVGFNKNIILYLITILLINIGFGVFGADFNLYILSMDMSPDFLGIILSLTPFAQVFAAIPIGFMTEKIGNKRSLIIVNLIVGFAYFLRVFSANQTLILFGSFLVGTVQAGYFIIRMPFISQYAGKQKDREFTIASIVFYTAMAVGNLAGGFLPAHLNPLFPNETITYRTILIGSSLLIILGTIPLFLLAEDKPEDTKAISLSPYLKGIDQNTVKFAVIEFFIGIGLGFLMFFMNVLFIYYYNSSLQAFGTMSAVLIIPTVIFLFIGPALAKKYNGLKVVIGSRILSAVAALLIAVTANPLLGASAYLVFRSLLGVGQSLWVSFASSISTKRSRTATSTWLEITFQIGFVVAALAGGQLIAREAYPTLGIISSVSMLVAFILTILFFGKKYLSHKSM